MLFGWAGSQTRNCPIIRQPLHTLSHMNQKLANCWSGFLENINGIFEKYQSKSCVAQDVLCFVPEVTIHPLVSLLYQCRPNLLAHPGCQSKAFHHLLCFLDVKHRAMVWCGPGKKGAKACLPVTFHQRFTWKTVTASWRYSPTRNVNSLKNLCSLDETKCALVVVLICLWTLLLLDKRPTGIARFI